MLGGGGAIILADVCADACGLAWGLQWVLWGPRDSVMKCVRLSVLMPFGLHEENPHARGTFTLQMSVVCL